MSNDRFYAIRISFHPDPETEFKEQFSTYADAKKRIESIAKGGDNWIIIKEEDKSYELINGIIKYQKDRP